MSPVSTYGAYTYGYGFYGGESYPVVSVELEVASVDVDLEVSEFSLELTV